jgi:copper chaperone
MSRTYRVKGMSCGGCVRAVTKAIVRRVPQAQVSVDLEKGLVTVEGEAAEAEVRMAVADAGFDYVGVAPLSP